MTTIAADAEQQSKDRYFERLAEIAKEMAASHGKEFAMGALVLAARWLAEGKSAPISETRGR